MNPGRIYKVEVGRSEKYDVPHLDLGSTTLGGDESEDDGSCDKLKQIEDKLRNAGSELEVAALLAQIGDLLNDCEIPARTDSVKEVISSTKEEVADLTVERNSRRPITVHRLPKEGQVAEDPEPTWQIVISSPGGSWQRTYGWRFAPNRDKEYFAKPPNPATTPDGSGGAPGSEDSPGAESVQNETTEGTHAENSLTSLPAVFWTWLPPGQRSQPIQHGPTAGLGVALSAGSANPSVFGGYSIRFHQNCRFHQNIGFALGVAFYQQKVLASKYAVGDPVFGSIDSDQLASKA